MSEVSLQAQVEQLHARVTALEAERAPQRTLTLAKTCELLGVSESTFRRSEADYRRLGLVEVNSATRKRFFDAASVERVRIRR